MNANKSKQLERLCQGSFKAMVAYLERIHPNRNFVDLNDYPIEMKEAWEKGVLWIMENYDDSDIPPPIGKQSIEGVLENIRNLITNCPIGHSFIYKGVQQSLYKAAAQIKCRIKVRKINGQGYRVWKIKDNERK